MEQNNSPDELFEIKPDIEPTEDDGDMTISKDVSTEAVDENPVVETEISSDDVTEDEAPADIIDAEADEVTAEADNSEETESIDEAVDYDDSDDDFSAELEEMEREEADLEILEEIGDSIVMQVDAELENSVIPIPIEPDNVEGPDDDNDDSDDDDEPRGFFARIPWWGYMVAGVVAVILFTVIWIAVSSSGRGMAIKWGSRYAAEQVTYQPVEPVEQIDVPDEIDDKDDEIDYGDMEVIDDDYAVVTPDISPIITPEPVETDDGASEIVPEERKVYNILLIGEENMNSGGYRGRSDLIMIATINAQQNKIKLTSVMRDCLVSIPNHADNRINAAYAIGGVALLYETLKQNLGVEIDNYLLVDFEGFEEIVNAVGGVDVELTSQEAHYLNTTNYIADVGNRTLVKGLNHLNGAQALGYCRIRNVATADNQYSDFGRTSRQREVLNSMYASASDMNYFGLVNLASKCLPYVTTDLTADDIERYINLILEIGIPNGIENFRIPVSGTYSEVLLRDMLVTKIDLQKNAEELRTIIYGQENP